MAREQGLESRDEMRRNLEEAEELKRLKGVLEQNVTALIIASLRKYIVLPLVRKIVGKTSRLRRLRFPMGGRCSSLREKIEKAGVSA